MKINTSIGKTTIISLSRKTNSILFNYKLCNNLVTCSQCVKDLGVLLDCKLYFHQHGDYILSQGLKMLGLIRYITSSFTTLESLLVLYSSLVRSKLEYASVDWNSTDSAKLERIKRKFAALCYTRSFSNASTSTRSRYEDILFWLNLLPLHMSRRHLDAVFLIDAFKCNIDCPSIPLVCAFPQGYQGLLLFCAS
jgi:hypothetical protein